MNFRVSTSIRISTYIRIITSVNMSIGMSSTNIDIRSPDLRHLTKKMTKRVCFCFFGRLAQSWWSIQP